jgi:putative hemolysin
LVSIEDIIEQIVGDIADEFDEDERVIEKLNEHTYLVDGNVYLDDLAEELNINLESENSETIGGFIIDLMGEIPKEEVEYKPFTYENLSFQIVSVKDRRIERVKIQVIPDADESEE